MIIPLITAPYLSRVIGAEGIGKYSYAYSIAYYFFIFIKLGLDNYGNRSIAKSAGIIELSRVFCSIYVMQLSLGVLVLAIYYLYSYFLASDKITALVMSMFVISGVLDVTWFFNGIEKFKFTVVRNTVVKIITTISIFCFIKSSDDIILYIAIMSVSFLMSQAITWPFVWKEITFVKPTVSDVLIHIKPNLILFVAVLAVSLYRYMDKIMLGAITGEYEVGIYDNSERLLQIPINFVNALGIVMIPKMSNIMHFSNDHYRIKKIIHLSEMFVCFLSTSISLGLIGICRYLVPLFYGYGFEGCISVLYILLPSSLFMAFANVIRTQYLIPMNKDNIYIRTIILGAIVNLVSNFWLIPIYGAKGAAVGTLLAEAAVCISQCVSVKKELPIKEYLLYSMPFLLAGLTMCGVLLYIPQRVNSLAGEMLIDIMIGAIIYLIVLMLILLAFRKKYRLLLESFWGEGKVVNFLQKHSVFRLIMQ